MRQTLSPMQEKVLVALIRYTKRHHAQPSFAELGQIVGNANVPRYVTQLIAKGWLASTGRARALEIPTDVYDGVEEES